MELNLENVGRITFIQMARLYSDLDCWINYQQNYERMNELWFNKLNNLISLIVRWRD